MTMTDIKYITSRDLNSALRRNCGSTSLVHMVRVMSP